MCVVVVYCVLSCFASCVLFVVAGPRVSYFVRLVCLLFVGCCALDVVCTCYLFFVGVRC